MHNQPPFVSLNRSEGIRANPTLISVPVLAAALLIIGCSDRGGTSVAKVTLGLQISPAMTAVFVAQDKGFFRAHGVDVELQHHTAGKFALEALLGGSVDYAVSGEVPVCLASLQGHELRVVTQVVESTTNEVRVVARKDGDLKEPREYFKAKRRKLATSYGGGPEFFTYTFLRHFEVGRNEVELISQRPQDMPASLEALSVDAISIFDPFAFVAEKRMGDRVITFSAPFLYSEIYVLAALPKQVQTRPDITEALVRGLVQAGEFIADHPEDAKEITRNYTKLDRDVIDGIWGNFSFRPALVQKLFDYWEAESRWAREKGDVSADRPEPDFHSIVDARFLKEAKPEAVKF